MEKKFQLELVDLIVKYLNDPDEPMQVKTCIYLMTKVVRGLPLLLALGSEDE